MDSVTHFVVCHIYLSLLQDETESVFRFPYQLDKPVFAARQNNYSQLRLNIKMKILS